MGSLTVAGHEDLGQTFFWTKVKVSGIYCSHANEDITMNPKANNPNFIQCSRGKYFQIFKQIISIFN